MTMLCLRFTEGKRAGGQAEWMKGEGNIGSNRNYIITMSQE